jgi:ABC-type sugar transport system substrate-binding protein
MWLLSQVLQGLETSEVDKVDNNDVARQLSQVIDLLRQKADDVHDAISVADSDYVEQLVKEHKDIMDEIRASERWLKVWFN